MRTLLEHATALWGGEALVFRTYWRSRQRTVDSDLAWIAGQCHKELFDGVLARLAAFDEALAGVTAPSRVGAEPDHLERQLVAAAQEYRHFEAFAAVYEALREPGHAPLDISSLREEWQWPENAALGELRAQHRRHFGELGVIAGAFTEGGGAALFEEGMALQGSAADELIADACSQVFEDEIGHVREGLDQLATLPLPDRAWSTLQVLVAEQLRQRIVMRNAQFGQPLDMIELAAAMRGEAEPAGATLLQAAL